MAARLNISQVEALIKKRGHLSDHQIYEMMKSRHVFQVQSELRRELERMEKSIQHDKKVMLASLNCQKAMFLKRMNTRKRSTRYLISLKSQLRDDKEVNGDDKAQNVDSLAGVQGEGSDHNTGQASLKLKSTLRKNGEDRLLQSKEECHPFISTSNGKWMKKLSDRSQTNLSKAAEVNGTYAMLVDDDPISEFEEGSTKACRNNQIAYLSPEVEQVNIKHSEEEKKVSSIGRSLTTVNLRKKPRIPMYRSLSSLSSKIRVSSIKNSFPEEGNRVRKSSNLKSAPVVSNVKAIKPKMPRKKQIPQFLFERPNREKTVTMLFIEKGNRKGWPAVSPFDIETWLRQNKERRGHTVILSTTYLDESDQHFKAESNPSQKPTALNLCTRQPIHQKPLRFKVGADQPSIRKRGHDWFLKFLDEKNKKIGIHRDQIKTENFTFTSNSRDIQRSLHGRKIVLPPIGRHSLIG